MFGNYISLSCLGVVILLMVQGQNAKTDSPRSEHNQNYCNTDDLNHSILVECIENSCQDVTSKLEIWPNDDKEVLHIYSTREGERFKINKLPNLDYKEPEHVRMLDINNTLYVESSSQLDVRQRQIRGFGTTITERLISYAKDETFLKNQGPILRDLFGLPPVGIGFTILRLQLTRTMLLSDIKSTLKLIEQIDSSLSDSLSNMTTTKIKVIVSLEDMDEGLGLQESLVSVSRSLKESRHLTCWAVAMNKEIELRDDDLSLIDVRKLFDASILLDTFNINAIKQAPNFIDASNNDFRRGVLLKSEFSSPYNILASLNQSYPEGDRLTISGYRRVPETYGDWQNAQNYAVSILNNLRYGSTGFLEEISETEILRDTKRQDCSIYSLRNGHNIHFRGPMYYAIGHFSRHIIEGSRILNTNVSTAPNMFAAHYTAFSIPNRNSVVAIILNDNEHLLPFRLAIDNRIKVFTDIQPKSFNTFVVRK